MSYATRIPVRFGDVDHARIVYYPRYVHYFHVAFEEFWREALGIPYAAAMRDHGLGFPAVRLDVTFREALSFGDLVDVHVELLRLGTSSIEWQYRVVRAADGVEAGRARITTVTVDMATFGKQPTPEWLREKLAAHLVAAPRD